MAPASRKPEPAGRIRFAGTRVPSPGPRIDLSGQAAIVTGGSRGIGRATVEALAQAGASVVFSFHRNRAAAEEVVERAGADRVVAVRADVSQPRDADRLVEAARRRHHRVDVLVNNAGIWDPPGGTPFENLSERAWRRTMAINLDGAHLVTRRVIPLMKRRRSGRIVFVSSTAGQRGEERHGEYAATKGALISLTKSLAVELGPHGILVNAVAPWWVDTDMSHAALVRLRRGRELKRGEWSPLDRVAAPEEIAGPILFLCSHLATYVTGEILNVNGGTILCG
ncbi:MAG TPA: SDR family oxidoreductase [Candidatus Polarisedimenticolia bacterium]|nr:SDR family oxidoreductase [Candidatus Polarisedimenticolia bacterium]